MMFFLSDGSEIPASTLMEVLLMNDFKLVINKITYDVQCPEKGKRHSYVTILTFPLSCGILQGTGLRTFLINQMTKKALENRGLSFSSRGVNDQ